MNEAQERAVEMIRTGMMEEFDLSHGAGRYELKQFVVHEHETFVSVVAEVGMVGDEGKWSEIFCRNRVHIFIGKRGGMKYPMMKRGRWYTKRFKTLWCTYYDQEYRYN